MTAQTRIDRPSITDAPKTAADYLAEARARQAGRGIRSKFMTVTDEQLAQADAHISLLLDPALRARMKAARDAKYAAIAREEADKVAAAMVAPITAGIDRLAADYRAWMETF